MELTVDFHVGHNYSQDLFMNIDSRWVESRGPDAENKPVTDETFMNFRGPWALNDNLVGHISSWPGAESVLRLP